MLLAAPWVARGVARADEAAARALLGPSRGEELALRVEALARSRAEIVAAADAERRRIERDLHDGAQQRLVSLAMNLGMARASLTDAPEPVRQVIEQAHDEAKEALAELRELVRGLHPAVLDDRGLDAALSGHRRPRAAAGAATGRRGHPLRPRRRGGRLLRRVRGPDQRGQARPAPASAEVSVERTGDRLHVVVADDGRGGATPPAGTSDGGGTGLRGLAQRAAAVDGTLTVDSPPGGPTSDHRGAAMRVVIAEDSVLLRAGLTKLLTDGGFEVVAAVTDAEALLRAVAEHRPDVAVVDVRMPPTHTDEGIRAALVIRRQYPEVAVLVLSQYVEERYATDLLSERTSAVGYLLKDRVAHVADFLDALRRVAAGGTALDPEVVAQLLRPPPHRPPRPPHPPGARGARADGRGPLQQRHRRSPASQPQRGREVRQQHLHQAGPATHRHRPPPGAGRAEVPRRMRETGLPCRQRSVSSAARRGRRG